ncbi:MAG: AtpZ/AtpI family protein [Phycisphaeraceae bacterium]|nr:MAG: AtpZ/AtpI family protein [Phycisphaeraceae bacterium]
MGQAPNEIRAWALGLDMAYAVGGMLVLGAIIDHFAGTTPWWMLGLALVGLVAGMYQFIREAMALNRASQRPGGAGRRGGENPAEQEKHGPDGSPGA